MNPLDFLWRMNTNGLDSNPNPSKDYADALKRIEALQAQDTEAVNPLCRTKFFSHDQKTEQVLVFFHGYTNCPEQFQELGTIFHQRGYSVLVARFPYHGLKDRLTPELARLTAKEMAVFTDEVIDIAQGLGGRVTVSGLSAGGIMTGWAAQLRSDVDHAVLIAPNFALRVVPDSLTALLMNIFLWLPNRFPWWDPRVGENTNPKHAYPRYSTHSLAEFTRLGFHVRELAGQRKPLTGKITVVTNAADLAVSNGVINRLVKDWQAQGVADLHTYEFPSSMGLIHDLIDPGQDGAKIDEVYPILIDLLTRE